MVESVLLVWLLHAGQLQTIVGVHHVSDGECVVRYGYFTLNSFTHQWECTK